MCRYSMDVVSHSTSQYSYARMQLWWSYIFTVNLCLYLISKLSLRDLIFKNLACFAMFSVGSVTGRDQRRDA